MRSETSWIARSSEMSLRPLEYISPFLILGVNMCLSIRCSMPQHAFDDKNQSMDFCVEYEDILLREIERTGYENPKVCGLSPIIVVR